MEQQTSFERVHTMVEHIFRALLPEHGLMIREEQIMLCHEMLDTLFEGKIALCDAGVGIGSGLYIFRAQWYSLHPALRCRERS